MVTIFSTIGSLGSAAGRKLAIAAVGGLMLAGASAAQAHDWDHHHRDRVEVDIAVGPAVRCEPVYETREVRVWVPPVYRTVVDRVWREPVYQTVCEKAFVPEVAEVREVRRRDGYRVCVTRERVVVVPAHYEDRNCQRLVAEGHFEEVTRQELVADGHYDVRVERVVVGERREVNPVGIIHPLLRGLGR